jgi:hypothetical protein
MRVLKDSNGQFYIDDEPLHIKGEDAREFLAQYEENNRTGNSPEKQRFLDECVQICRKYHPA